MHAKHIHPRAKICRPEAAAERAQLSPDSEDQSNTQRQPRKKAHGEHRKKALFSVLRVLFSVAGRGQSRTVSSPFTSTQPSSARPHNQFNIGIQVESNLPRNAALSSEEDRSEEHDAMAGYVTQCRLYKCKKSILSTHGSACTVLSAGSFSGANEY
jgi:hypothetical protein